MKPLKFSYCSAEQKPCMKWAEKYFKDCLCNFKDEISFAFGIASLICWGIAEIPQIITNYRNKSANGVSLAFLSTWIVGDVFNLVGCFLEPATLPTQFYTALLYTITTIVLALQCIYYDHFHKWWIKCDLNEDNLAKNEKSSPESNSEYRHIPASNAPVEVPRPGDFYYISARSLAGSVTPPIQCSSYIKAKSGPCTLECDSDSSSEDEGFPAARTLPTKIASQPWPIPRSGGYGTFLAAAANFPARSNGLILKEQDFGGNAFGQWLGWLMAAIYMGGRIPQIWLNIRRGSVEGLNPLMFIFALIANATYVGSILVRTTEWEKIKANMPWLLDAIVCVVLDLLIILQYIYYKYMRQKRNHHGGYEADDDDHVEANKPLL